MSVKDVVTRVLAEHKYERGICACLEWANEAGHSGHVAEAVEAALREVGLLVVPSTSLRHRVVLHNGRDDVVCACGQQFSRDRRANDMSEAGRSAVSQWVEHYKAEGLPHREDQ